MTSLQVTFPEPWAVLPTGASGQVRAERLVAGLAELGSETQDAAREYFAALLPTLDRFGVDGLASLVVQDPAASTTVRAFCVLGVLAREVAADEATGDEASELRAIAEAGPHPGLERETTPATLPVGAAVRSSAFRHATELVDPDGVAPYSAELRFAFPIDRERVGILHFETLSLVYLEALTEMFDAIAGTARVA